jgi:uncharacterized protein (DUF305 family)
MKVLTRLWVPVVFAATMLLLAACGDSGGTGADQQGDGSGGSQETRSSEASREDTGGPMEETTQATSETTGGMSGMEDMEGMDHGSMGSEEAARQMVMEDGSYSDERFIDAMVPHHQGAVEMAEVALENADHEEIRAVAEDIVTSQEAEIELLKQIKQREYGTSEVPMEMSPEQMENMGMMADPQELANQEPFDKAFIDAMIPHHESAIAMARVAVEESEIPEIRAIARDVVRAQQREIRQMNHWREEWYPQG